MNNMRLREDAPHPPHPASDADGQPRQPAKNFRRFQEFRWNNIGGPRITRRSVGTYTVDPDFDEGL